MKPENIKFLEDNRHHYETYRRAGFIQNLDYGTKDRMQQVIAEEFMPGYTTSLWCGDCVAQMIVSAYLHYDKWKADQERIVKETFPKHEKN